MIRRSAPAEAETHFLVQRAACLAAFPHVSPLDVHDAALAELAGCAEIHLWTLEENHRARRFYERHGWRPNGETRVVPYPPNPLDVGYTFRRESPSP